MRSLLIILALVSIIVIASGCVQSRVGNPGYNDPYTSNSGKFERRWWGTDNSNSNVNLDKFIYRWEGLLK